MSFLKNIFNSNTEPKKEVVSTINWIPLTTLSQFEEIKEASKTNTVLIFKHSTRCGTSRMVIKQFEKSFNSDLKNVHIYYLDLLNFRDISNAVASEFQVFHQSPQLLVIKNGVVVAHASHYDVLELKY